jgi:hypothetical protein
MRLREAALLLGFEGEAVSDVQFATSSCTAIVQLDTIEVQRREAMGLGPVLDHQLIQALSGLPLESPVGWETLDPVVRAVLGCAPAGVLRTTPFFVERLWRPALTVSGVLVVADDWRASLERVGVFAPDAPRGLLLTRPLQDASQVVSRARRFGIGVVGADPGGKWQLLQEASNRHVRATARHWRFLETVYATWLARGAQASVVAQAFR